MTSDFNPIEALGIDPKSIEVIPESSVEAEVNNFRELYVGDDKKYKTDEDAYKGLHHANEHIKRLEAEQQELRQQLATAPHGESKIQELLDVLKQPASSSLPAGTTMHAVQQAQTVDIDAIAERVLSVAEAKRKAEEAKQVEVANRDAAVKNLEATYGSLKLGLEALSKTAEVYGGDVVNLLIAKSPNKLIDLVRTTAVPSGALPQAAPAGNNSILAKPDYFISQSQFMGKIHEGKGMTAKMYYEKSQQWAAENGLDYFSIS